MVDNRAYTMSFVLALSKTFPKLGGLYLFTRGIFQLIDVTRIIETRFNIIMQVYTLYINKPTDIEPQLNRL